MKNLHVDPCVCISGHRFILVTHLDSCQSWGLHCIQVDLIVKSYPFVDSYSHYIDDHFADRFLVSLNVPLSVRKDILKLTKSQLKIRVISYQRFNRIWIDFQPETSIVLNAERKRSFDNVIYWSNIYTTFSLYYLLHKFDSVI